MLFIKLYGIKLFSNYASLRIKMTSMYWLYAHAQRTLSILFFLAFFLSFDLFTQCEFYTAFVWYERASLTSVTCSYASTHKLAFACYRILMRICEYIRVYVWDREGRPMFVCVCLCLCLCYGCVKKGQTNLNGHKVDTCEHSLRQIFSCDCSTNWHIFLVHDIKIKRKDSLLSLHNMKKSWQFSLCVSKK